jgi:hypothetical protein
MTVSKDESIRCLAVRLTPLSDDLRMRNKSCNVIGPMKIKLKDRFSLLELTGTGRWKSTVFYPPPAFARSDAQNLFRRSWVLYAPYETRRAFDQRTKSLILPVQNLRLANMQ